MDSLPLFCPTCSEQALQSKATTQGPIERCPSCGWFFVDLKVLAACSEDKDQFNGLIAEATQFLLPTGRDCPKGVHKLHDGRVRSRGVILTICPQCEALWTDLSTLGRLNEELERSLRAQFETAATVPVQSGSTDAWRSGPDVILPIDDQGFARLLREAAHFFNGLANRFGKSKPLPLPQSVSESRPIKQESVPAPVWEPLPPPPEPEKPAQVSSRPAPIPEPPKPAFKEPMLPESPVQVPEPEPEVKPLPVPVIAEPPQPRPKPEPLLEPKREPEEELKPEPKVEELLPEASLEPSEDKEDARRRILNNLGKVQEPEPTPNKWLDLPQPEWPKEGFLNRITNSLKPKEKPPKASLKPKVPEIRAVPAPEKDQPAVLEPPKDLPKIEVPVSKVKPSKKPGFFDLFKPLPKTPKPSVPVVKKSPEAAPVPVPISKIDEPPKSTIMQATDAVEEPKPKTSVKKPVTASKKGSIAQFFALFKPLPKSPKKEARPVKAAQEISTQELSLPPEDIRAPIPASVKPSASEPEKPTPVLKPEPVQPLAPAAATKKTEKPKSSAIAQFFALFKPLPKKEKPKEKELSVLKTTEIKPEPASLPPPKAPETMPVVIASILPQKGGVSLSKRRLVIWLPRVAPIIIVLIFGIAGDNEWGTALAWGIVSWALIRLVYLALMYPFKGFALVNIADLSNGNLSLLKGKPVHLKGRLESRRGDAIGFTDGTGDIALDRFASWEFVARLLAVANLSEFLKEEEVTIQGWYRSIPSPSIEVNEIRTPKTFRKSFVRWMRWGAAFLVLIVFSLILFGMD